MFHEQVNLKKSIPRLSPYCLTAWNIHFRSLDWPFCMAQWWHGGAADEPQEPGILDMDHFLWLPGRYWKGTKTVVKEGFRDETDIFFCGCLLSSPLVEISGATLKRLLIIQVFVISTHPATFRELGARDDAIFQSTRSSKRAPDHLNLIRLVWACRRCDFRSQQLRKNRGTEPARMGGSSYLKFINL